jgi:hypothetical protein
MSARALLSIGCETQQKYTHAQYVATSSRAMKRRQEEYLGDKMKEYDQYLLTIGLVVCILVLGEFLRLEFGACWMC